MLAAKPGNLSESLKRKCLKLFDIHLTSGFSPDAVENISINVNSGVAASEGEATSHGYSSI